MAVWGEFLPELLAVFLQSAWTILRGICEGLAGMFDVRAYAEVFRRYASSFDGLAWVLAIAAAVLLGAAVLCLLYLICATVRKWIHLRKTLVYQAELLRDVGDLNRRIAQLSAAGEAPAGREPPGDPPRETGDGRFYKLSLVDAQMRSYIPPVYDDALSLPDICVRFRNFACSRMGLYYDLRVIRLFLAAFASSRLIILQGISGTGKTSLPYAFGKFLQNDAAIACVQPSWRDRSELFGYFNEFTKRFNETEILKRMYEATYKEDVHITILDEMNIARVEYYFAELLSILEMPSRGEWMIDLAPGGWSDDPVHLHNGRFLLPENMWYVGTANHDDSTFAISDKVYDRALPIGIDAKGAPFDAPPTDPIRLRGHHLETLFAQAKTAHKVSETLFQTLESLDDYMIAHFRTAIGNRIVKQMQDFIPAYVGCGGSETDGFDYMLANKILRKLEGSNLSLIRKEISGLSAHIDALFGADVMTQAKAYLEGLHGLL